MKIKSLTLYKTSLDEFYHNVIDADPDESLNNATYKELILDAYYSPMTIYNSNDIKSVIEENGLISVSIARMYEDVIEGGYNYCAINTGNKYLFYFVVGARSYNDGNSPSMLITLKRDCWANNIEYFTNHNYTDKQLVVRSHFNRWYGVSGGVKPYYRVTGDVCDFRKISKVSTEIAGERNIGIVWCMARLSGGALMEGSGIALDLYPKDVGVFGCIPIESSSPSIAFPIMSYTMDSDGLVRFDGKITFGGVDYDYFSVVNSKTQLGFSTFFCNNAFEDVWLTTIPPFPFTTSGTFGSRITVTPIDCGITDLYISSERLSELDVVDDTTWNYAPPEGINKQKYVGTYSGTLNVSETNTHTFSTPIDLISSGSVLFDYNASYEDTKLMEPRIYVEPFRSCSISVGDIVAPINTSDTTTNVSIQYDCAMKSQPRVRIYENGRAIMNYTSLGSIGQLPTFNTNSGNSSNMGLQLIGNMLKAGVTYATTGSMSAAAIGAARGMAGTMLGLDNSETAAEYKHKSGSSDYFKYLQEAHPDYSVDYAFRANQSYDIGMEKNALNYGRSIERAESKHDLEMSHARDGLRRDIYDSVINSAVQFPQSVGSYLSGGSRAGTSPSQFSSDCLTRYNPVYMEDIWLNSSDLEPVLSSMYMFGYKRSDTKSVKRNSRVWFDFCQTSNCSLPEIKNFLDRNILEQAFNRGVTKWHWGPLGLQSDFHKNINNIEREWVKTEDAPLSYKFFKSSYPLVNYGTVGDVSVCTLNGGEIVNGIGLTGRATITNVPGMINNGSAQVWQFKLTQLPSNWQTQFIELVGTNARTGYGPNQAYGITVNGDFGSKQGSNSSTLCTMPNGINDFLDKTITVYARSEGGSYYFTKTRIFVDDVMIFDGYGGNGFADNSTLDLMYNCDGIMRAFRVYKLPYNEIWDSEIVARHLL